MIKKIFIYWDSGFLNSPIIVKQCLLSWKLYNPTWEIIELDANNINRFIDIDINLKEKTINQTALSDIIRIYLLETHGGLWCDATLFCNCSLDTWLYNYTNMGFFAYRNPGADRLLSSWFLYAEKENYIIKEWITNVKTYWSKNQKAVKYYWFHYIFNNLYYTDENIRKIWDKVPRLQAKEPHFIQEYGLMKNLHPKVKQHIEKNKSNVYKLTYKVDLKKYNLSSNLHALFNIKNDIRFIHIGKCGGTSIVSAFKFNQYHLVRNYNDKSHFIIWLRNPLKRFVSAFNHVLTLVNMDISKLNINNLTIENCLAPERIKDKFNKKYCFSESYDKAILYFGTANRLAEALTSNNEKERKIAETIFKSELEHIFKGIGWYLYNGDFIEKMHNKIFFVGTLENMEKDCNILCQKLNVNSRTPDHIRYNTFENTKKYLSEKAIQNLKNVYRETDYKTLEIFKKYNFISEKIYQDYQNYPIYYEDQ
jgi:hypothetical protein